MITQFRIGFLSACFVAVWSVITPSLAEPVHGLAMHGDPKYPADFTHFDYVNPDAPKGGILRLSSSGGFDSFNPMIPKGRPAAGVLMLYDTLTVESLDEVFSKYGLIAETVEIPKDRSWVAFTLNREARWHDGTRITPEDVIFSFNLLREQGNPEYRFYYANVEVVEKTGPRQVTFRFEEGDNRELPLILGQLPVLPKHYWETRDFTKTTLEPPLSSGPYRIKSFEPDRYVEYERVTDYWAKDHPVRRGMYNFDTLRFEYYQDRQVALEAFKTGAFDYRSENSSKSWATAYDFKAVRDGLVKKAEFPHQRLAPMQAFIFNTRRPIFKDSAVRQALAYAFDFEWSNKTLFYGQYTRTRSYFQNSELAATGLPEGEELQILKTLSEEFEVPEEIFTTEYNPPETKGDGNIRSNLRTAIQLLKGAGWTIDKKTKKLTKKDTGEVMEFEILLVSPLFERIVLPFKKNLERLGVEVTVRMSDSAQYQKRVTDFDFDMVVLGWAQSDSPGNEQREYWTTPAADRPGGRNYSGLKNLAVDALVEQLIAAKTRESLVAHTRALDRLLQWQHIVIPNWHSSVDRIAYWDKFGLPSVVPKDGMTFFSWWIDPEKDKALADDKASVQE